jgi:glycosyltransferase involved in cell wall biosynthesis
MLESQIEILQESLQIKQKEITDLQKAIESYQKIITDIHQSFVLRALHKYDKTIGKYIPIRPKKYAKSMNEHSTVEEQKQVLDTLNFRKDRKDILCFPIINWDFRYQRPQHLISKFAEQGHRVFYFTVNLRKLTSPYEIKNLGKNLYQVEINLPTFFDIYKDRFDNSLLTKILESFEIFKNDVSLDAISFVQFPTWYPLVSKLKSKYNFPIIFDCLDDFTGFSNVQKEREKEELSLISESSLVTASSSYLLKKVMKKTSNCIFLPNAGEFEHFNKKPSENLVNDYSKPIIGYFGAISDWFDDKLIEFLASKKPNYTFILIGHTYGSDIKKLEKFKNVHFIGERPYSELPKYLHGFDVCLIPFKNVPLIEATHPVKIYEYFAAGKPVIATNMTELYPMANMCYLAKDKDDFLAKLDLAVNEKDISIVKNRIKFASENTWNNRFDTLYNELKKINSFDIERHS